MFLRLGVRRMVGLRLGTIVPLVLKQNSDMDYHGTSRRGYNIMSSAPAAVKHDPRALKFYIPLEPGKEAFLQYSLRSESCLDLYHTEVPPSYRGRGLGATLAEAAFSHARQQGSKVILTCTYLQYYITKHPEHSDLIGS